MIQCFNWDDNILNIETNTGIRFNLQLKGQKTIICGDSATGKTLLCNIIKEYAKDTVNNPILRKYDTSNIVILDSQNKEELSEAEHKLIIIDRADIVLNDSDIDIINSDTYMNKYLIFSRKPLGLYISPNYFGEFKDENGLITTSYIFNIF